LFGRILTKNKNNGKNIVEEFMEYAIVLYFNKETEKYLNSLIVKIAKNNGNEYMTEHKIPPHLTIILFHKNGYIDQVIKTLDNNIGKFLKSEIIFSFVGIFNPAVVFVAPAMNNYLAEINSEIINYLKDIEDIEYDKNYIQNQWIPHLTLATKLNEQEIVKSIEIATKEFKVFEGKVEAIGLAECNPYKEIKRWKIV
jgi:2'-5' RNA ligase